MLAPGFKLRTKGKRILELGSGGHPMEGEEVHHLDRDRSAPHVEFYGDIRSLWNPKDFPDVGNLDEINENFYDIVAAVHFIEHIEWIYQHHLFEYARMWLKPGGYFVVETPNLEWIAKVYLDKRFRNRFPMNEHPDIKTRSEMDFRRWINFKIFSGCSPGDYHHCLYDATMLRGMFEKAGFTNIKIKRGPTLWGIGQALKEGEFSWE